MPKLRAEECVKATCMGINSLTPPRILHSSKEISTALSSKDFQKMEAFLNRARRRLETILENREMALEALRTPH